MWVEEKGICNPGDCSLAARFSRRGSGSGFCQLLALSTQSKDLTKEASKQGLGETVTQSEYWSIFYPDPSGGTKWDLMDNALTDAQHRQLALELRIAATAGEPGGLRQTRERVGLSADEPARRLRTR